MKGPPQPRADRLDRLRRKVRRASVQWLLAWGVAAGFATAGGLLVVETGAYDVRAIIPHTPIVAWATHTTMIHSFQLRAAAIPAPIEFTSGQVLAGFRDYDADCAICHGGPGVSRQPWVSGMTPTPPYLVDAPRHWTASQLHFIVDGGVKMTGMPGWRDTLSDREIWNVVAFLEAMPYLSARDYAQMRERTAPSGNESANSAPTR